MPKPLLIALKDIRIRLRDRAGLAFSLLTPIALTLILGLAFGGGDEASTANFRVPVAVVNHDAGQPLDADGSLASLFAPEGASLPTGLFDFDLSSLGLDDAAPGDFVQSSGDGAGNGAGDGGGIAFGQVLVEVLTSEELGAILDAELVEDEAAARALVQRGEQYCCVVVIPEAFTANLLNVPTFGDEPATESAAAESAPAEANSPEANVLVYSDPGSAIGAQVVESIVRQVVSGFATNSLGFNVTLESLVESEQPPTLAQLSTVLQNLLANLGGQIEAQQSLENTGIGPATSLATVELLDGSGEAADFNVLAYFAPSMAILFVAFGALQGARTILRERREGTFDRLNATPTRQRSVLLGKLLGIFFSSALQFGALLVASTLLFQLVWGDPLGVALLAILITLAFTSLGLLIAVVARSEGEANTISTFVVMVFAAVGGNFLPASNFPAWMQSISQWTPNYWSVNGFLKLAQGEGLPALGPELAALAAMTALFFAAGLWLYRQRFA